MLTVDPKYPQKLFCGETHQLGESVFFFYAASLLQAITLTGKLCGCPQLFRSFGKHISLCQKSNIDLRRLSVELRTFLTAHSASCRSLHPLHVAGGRSPLSLALCKRVASGWKLGSGKWRSICESGLVQISSKILLWWTQLRFWDGVLACRVFFGWFLLALLGRFFGSLLSVCQSTDVGFITGLYKRVSSSLFFGANLASTGWSVGKFEDLGGDISCFSSLWNLGPAGPCRRHGKASLKVPEVVGEPVIFPHD